MAGAALKGRERRWQWWVELSLGPAREAAVPNQLPAAAWTPLLEAMAWGRVSQPLVPIPERKRMVVVQGKVAPHQAEARP